MNSYISPKWTRNFAVALIQAPVLIAFALICQAMAQSRNTDPGHKEQLSVGSLSFSCPNGFSLQRTAGNYQVSYMRNTHENLALFVAIPRPGAGDEYVDHLGTFLASYLFPQEWAVFAYEHLDWHQKVSKFETGGGRIRIFNGAQALVLDYRRLQVTGKEVIVGFLVDAGRDEHAADALGRRPDAGSPAGSYAEAHLMASITGEKYDDLVN